jgi:peptide/nickel transport system substrate-binding protein
MKPTSRPAISLSRRELMAALAGAATVISSGIKRGFAAGGGSSVLHVRSELDVTSLDPGNYRSPGNVDVMCCIYPRLIGFKPESWDWQLESADEVRQIDPTHIRFRLKDGLKWSGGFGDVTAEDVKFSFERVIDPAMKSSIKYDWGPLSHVDVEDRLSGVIVLKEPYAPAWTIALPFGVGLIVSKAAYTAAGAPRLYGTNAPAAYGGPYKLKELRPAELAVLERNEAWTQKPAAYDTLYIHLIADGAAAEIAYESGAIDYSAIRAISIQRYKDNPPANTTLMTSPGSNYYWLGLNSDHPKLKDKRVRLAISYAVNVKQLVDTTFHGFAPVATGPIAPGLLGYREKTIVPLEGDVAKAMSLLKEAGVSDLQLTLAVNNEPVQKTMAEIIQAQLKSAGIDCTIQGYDQAAFRGLGERGKGEQWRDLQAYITFFNTLSDPYYSTTWFTTENIGTWNWEGFSNPRYDELDKSAVKESDHAIRAKMYQEMADLLEESGCYRFLTYGVAANAYRSTLVPQMTPLGEPLFAQFTKA